MMFSFYIQAKLPRGIDNIRPHLQDVDNVPLLVPLFTDCTPEGSQVDHEILSDPYKCTQYLFICCMFSATREMIEIMQEYGEVVCCSGSSLNVANVGIFNQADIR